MTIATDSGTGDVEFASESAVELCIENLLDLLIVTIIGKGKELQESQVGLQHIHPQVPVGSDWLHVGSCRSDLKKAKVDIGRNNKVASLNGEVDVFGCQVIADGNAADATAKRS